MADIRDTQNSRVTVKTDPGDVTVTQGSRVAVLQINPVINVTQGVRSTVLRAEPPPMNVTQMSRIVVGVGLYNEHVNVCVIT